MSKMGNFTVNFTHFRPFWVILPILVGKRIADLNGFTKNSSRKWVKFIKTFICVVVIAWWNFETCSAFLEVIDIIEPWTFGLNINTRDRRLTKRSADLGRKI
jgi:hypothetical protein